MKPIFMYLTYTCAIHNMHKTKSLQETHKQQILYMYIPQMFSTETKNKIKPIYI
jgi:hypothetical protein